MSGNVVPAGASLCMASDAQQELLRGRRRARTLHTTPLETASGGADTAAAPIGIQKAIGRALVRDIAREGPGRGHRTLNLHTRAVTFGPVRTVRTDHLLSEPHVPRLDRDSRW